MNDILSTNGKTNTTKKSTDYCFESEFNYWANFLNIEFSLDCEFWVQATHHIANPNELTVSDQKKLLKISSPKRLNDFLLGRNVLSMFNLKGICLPSPNISISHSGGIAIGIFGRSLKNIPLNIGIDLQIETLTNPALIDRISCEKEHSLDIDVLALWSVKEACYKAHSNINLAKAGRSVRDYTITEITPKPDQVTYGKVAYSETSDKSNFAFMYKRANMLNKDFHLSACIFLGEL